MNTSFITLIISVLIFPFAAQAADLVKIELSGNQTPGSEMILTATSPFLNLRETENTIMVDGDIIKSEIGLVKSKIIVGDIATPMEITFTAKSPTQTAKAETIILPGYADLLFEAQTVTPPFYRGKAIPTNKSIIRIFALPYFSKDYLTEPMRYKWGRGDEISLGEGNNLDSVQTLGAWDNEKLPITLQVFFQNQKLSRKIDIPSLPSEGLFYRLSPTNGVQTQHSFIGKVDDNKNTLSLLLVPYGMSFQDWNQGKILYEWVAGEKSIEKGIGKSHERITLSRNRKDDTQDDIKISLRAQNTSSLMQAFRSQFIWSYKP